LKKYLETIDCDWFKRRLIGVVFCVVALFIILILRLFHLQIVEGEELKRLSINNCIRLQDIDPSRGLIFDRNGNLLVNNRPSFNLNIIINDAKPIENTVKNLLQYMNISEKEVIAKINRSKGMFMYKPVLLKKDIGRTALASIEAHRFDLPGIDVNIKPRRHYIYKYCASHLIGYLSEINSCELKSDKYSVYKAGDFIGRFGVEKKFEQYLRGKIGGRQVEVNAKGRVVRVIKTVNARPGYNLYLTIDLKLQKKAEELLKGLAGAVVAMEPLTGEILGLASSPSFDQNNFVVGMTHKQWNLLISNTYRPLENKVLQGEYPPASTYKMITAIAALEEGIIDRDSTFSCNGSYKYGNRIFRCWKKSGHGNVDIIQALSESCDVFFYQIGHKLGADRLAWYARKCGLGKITGIKSDQEASGLVPDTEWKKRRTGNAWQGGETLSVAIGQSYNLVTPIQMVVLTSAIANGGVRNKPKILREVRTAEGSIVCKRETESYGKLPASEDTLKIIKKGMWETVNGSKGTAKNAFIKGIDASGKTGTAQVVNSSIYGDDDKVEKLAHHKPHAWFLAYAPSNDPKIAVAVIVEHGEHGSSTAAPIAMEIIRLYLSDFTQIESELVAE